MDAEEHAVIEDAFVAGFREAPDKRAFLALARIPLTLAGRDGTALRLIEVRLDDRYRVGSTAPGFGTRELSYQPLPGVLVTRTTRLTFVYVSATGGVELPLDDVLHTADGHGGHAHAEGKAS